MSVTVDRMASGSIFLGLKEAAAAGTAEEEENECSPSLSSSCTISSSSSIGKDSDVTDGEDCEDNEVQSAYKGTTSLDSMEALEEVLPIRRGISKFYNGKSKSFTSLAEASSSSCLTDIVKPENAYTRKRRNLLAFNLLWEKKGSFPRGSGMISKRPISASKSTLALAVAMSSSESISSGSDDSNSSSCSKSPPQLPPMHPRSRASHCNLASLSSHNNLALLPSPRQEFSPY